jgi:hypothetical protein
VVADAGNGGATFCEEQQQRDGGGSGVIFCDDFEKNDLNQKWPTIDTQLGTVAVVDGAPVGRPGNKVLHIARTKSGSDSENSVGVARLITADELAVRVSYDLRMNEWPLNPENSNFLTGNVDHGRLRTWLALYPNSRELNVLLYTGDGFFSKKLGQGALLTAPNNRWEHYEVVVVPGNPAHFELWVGTGPNKTKAATTDDTIAFPPDNTKFAPVIVTLGLLRSNVTPMPEVEAFYDNVVVTPP